MLRVAELWFDEEPVQVPSDIARYFQRSQPMSDGVWTRFCTVTIDLKGAPDELLSKTKKDTRYEIRRAESQDHVQHQMWTSTDAERLHQFISFYDSYAGAKSLAAANQVRLQKMSATGALTLSAVRDETGSEVVWHAYYRTPERARLLYSASLLSVNDPSARKSWFGRANRFHHWRDMLALKELGVTCYDFGGWYEGTDPKRLNINQFKSEFGGEVVLNFNGQRGLTLAGKLALKLYSTIRPDALA